MALFILIVNAKEQTNFDQGNASTLTLSSSSAVNEEVKAKTETVRQEAVVEPVPNDLTKRKIASASFGVYLNVIG